MSHSFQNTFMIVLLLCSITVLSKLNTKEFTVEFEHGDDIEILSKFDDYFEFEQDDKFDPNGKFEVVRESYEELVEHLDNLEDTDIPEEYKDIYNQLLEKYGDISDKYEEIQNEVGEYYDTESMYSSDDYYSDDPENELNDRISKINNNTDPVSVLATKLCMFYLI